MSAGTMTPPAETREPEPGLSPEPAPAKGKSAPTQYVVVGVLHRWDSNAAREAMEADENDPRAKAFASHVPSVPFVLGGWETPEVFESRNGGSSAKEAALAAHPELVACVREPGLSLATWPRRSYNFKRVEFETRPDKLTV